MRAVVLALALATFSVPAAAQDASPAAPTAEGRTALVLVVDAGRARVNPDRLLRTVEGTLGRAVVRITDARASAAVGTLTFAHESRGRWLVRFDTTGGSASTIAEITRPGIYDVTLAQAARRVVAEIETQPAPTPSPPSAQAPRSTDFHYVGWADEILDPFSGVPAPPRRELAIASEVLDPFAPVAARRVTFSEVLDPWGR